MKANKFFSKKNLLAFFCLVGCDWSFVIKLKDYFVQMGLFVGVRLCYDRANSCESGEFVDVECD